MSILDVNNISMNYHTKQGVIEAIKNVSFHVEKGDFLSLLGPSGCGKSTILNLLAGLITPSNGCILYDGKIIEDPSNIFGYMFQKDHLFDWLTVWDNITLGLRIRHKLTSENRDNIDALLIRYGLSKFKNIYPNQLSGGMRQRVALIRTLALNPEILILDEPFSALDYQTRLTVCDEVSQIIKNEEKTVIMVTHDISEAISTSSKIVLLSKRPSTVKLNFPLDFDSSLTPIQRRDTSIFKDYFNLIWRELDHNE